MRTFGVVFNLFVCVILSRDNAVTAVIYVENGKNVTLNPNIQGKPEEILWTLSGNKVAEHDLTEFHEYGQFKGRSGIETTTGQLTVRHMTSQDSGIYISVIQIDGRQQISENQVQVIDAVQEPDVTCELNNITKSKTLFCSVSSQIQASYEWTGSNLVQHSGQELPISKEEKPDSVFTCTVKNEVSQKKTSFALKDCPTDIPHPENIRENDDITLPVILSVIGAIIMIAMAVTIYFICKRRNKAKASTQPMCVLTSTEAQDDVEQPLKNNHNAENNEELDISEDADKSEKNETERIVDIESANHSKQRNSYREDGENKEQEMTDTEIMSKERDFNESSKAFIDKPDPSDQRSESGEDLHNYEDDEKGIYEVQDLTGPAQDSTSNE